MNDVFEDAAEDNSPIKCDDPRSPKEIEVGDEVEIHITTQSIGERSWEYIWPHIGTITARWRCLEGALWAIVEIVRTIAEGKSSNTTPPSDYVGCLFLARSYSSKDSRLFRAMRAADAKAEEVVARVRGDIDDLSWLEYMDQFHDRNRQQPI